jgi:hypothetical protein
MNYIDRKEPEGSLSKALKDIMPQLATGIAQNVHQRRQQQNTAFGLQAALGLEPNESQLLSNLDPHILGAFITQKLKEPAQKTNYDLAKSMSGNATGGTATGGTPSGGTPSGGSGNMSLPDKGQLTDKQLDTYMKQTTENKRNQIKDKTLNVKLQEGWRKKVEKLNAENDSINDTKNILSEISQYYQTGQVISGATQQVLQTLGLNNAITNAPTQATGKQVAQLVLSRMGNIKGVPRLTNMITSYVDKSKPGLFNTPEGLSALADSLNNGLESLENINNLRIEEYDKLGNNPQNAPTNPDKNIQKQIKAIQDQTLKNVKDIVNKHSGVKNQEEQVDKPDDPTTYNTLKDKMYFRLDDGTLVGSDGKRQRKVEIVGGIPRFID